LATSGPFAAAEHEHALVTNLAAPGSLSMGVGRAWV
jgi:hypothetical protein